MNEAMGKAPEKQHPCRPWLASEKKCMKKIKISKGQIIQSEGELNSKVYFVTSGLLRSYAIDENGKENIFMFAPEGWVIADSNPPDQPTVLYIAALENSVVRVFPKDIEAEKENIVPIFRRLNILQNRILMLISTNAIERYEHFVKMYPNLVQRVPQRMIASYLGVTPETL
ncbi:MAG: Crp/Fnr family transcriptional regulator, partial [Bacteroidota bacterium]